MSGDPGVLLIAASGQQREADSHPSPPHNHIPSVGWGDMPVMGTLVRLLS